MQPASTDSPQPEKPSKPAPAKRSETSRKNIIDLREAWLNAAVQHIEKLLVALDHPMPKTRISVGFPSSGKAGSRVDESFAPEASADGTPEIFIAPDSAEPVEILTRIARQCVHVALNFKAKLNGKPIKSPHGPEFRALATQLGFQGKMRKPEPNAFLRERLVAIAEEIGPFPHAALDANFAQQQRISLTGKKKQKGRMLKVECRGTKDEPCGYNPHLSRYWIEKLGAVCPKHGPIDVKPILEARAEDEQEEASSDPAATPVAAEAERPSEGV